MTTVQDVYNDIHMKQIKLTPVTNLQPISEFLNVISKDITIPVADVHVDLSGYNNQYVWLVNDILYRIRISYANYASLWINKVAVVANKFTLLNHSVLYTTTNNYIFYTKYDENTGRVHCDSGPAIIRYDRQCNGKRILSGVTYKLHGKTIAEKAWNKKFGTNFNYKDQIEMEKVFKIFGKKFKIAHVDNTKENIRLVPFV